MALLCLLRRIIFEKYYNLLQLFASNPTISGFKRFSTHLNVRTSVPIRPDDVPLYEMRAGYSIKLIYIQMEEFLLFFASCV